MFPTNVIRLRIAISDVAEILTRSAVSRCDNFLLLRQACRISKRTVNQNPVIPWEFW